MARPKKTLPIGEAIDHLTTLSQLPELSKECTWHKADQNAQNEKLVPVIFTTIREYLKTLVNEQDEELSNPEVRQGVQSMMLLVGDAVDNLDKHEKLFKNKKIRELQEFSELEKYYKSHLLTRFQKEAQEDEVEETTEEEFEVAQMQRLEKQEVDALLADKNYELLFIHSEIDQPYFTRLTLRHLRQAASIEDVVISLDDEDPLLKIRAIHDRDLNASSYEIFKRIKGLTDEFYACITDAVRKEEFIVNLRKALMSLMLGANMKNLVANTFAKTCQSYFLDFHTFLREALACEAYKLGVSELDHRVPEWLRTGVKLVHTLCFFFFTRTGSRSKMIEMIHDLVQRGGGTPIKSLNDAKLVNELQAADLSIRKVLKGYPSGPILQNMDIIREMDPEHPRGFDPMAQHNLPQALYKFNFGGKDIDCIRLPCPTRQRTIVAARIVEEFSGFISYLAQPSIDQKLLVFNLQERGNPREVARCRAIESMQERAEYRKQLTVVTFPKSGDFYDQVGSYKDLNNLDAFKDELLKQFKAEGAAGYFFPARFDRKLLYAFAESAIDVIAEGFYHSDEDMNVQERKIFIELFYQFIILKMVEVEDPDGISFSCKDAVDLGAAQNALFFLFVDQLSNRSAIEPKEIDLIYWMLYSPALTVRERAIREDVFERFISTLKVLRRGAADQGNMLRERLSALFPGIDLQNVGYDI